MITVELADGTRATVSGERWTVPENDELQRIFNSPEMQPPDNGYYAPSEDYRCAAWVTEIWGGKIVASNEQPSVAGIVY